MQEWTCARCESSAAAPDRRLLEAMGWRFGGDAAMRGVCPVCVRKERDGTDGNRGVD